MGTVEAGRVLLALSTYAICTRSEGNGTTCARMVIKGKFSVAELAQVQSVMTFGPAEQAMSG